MIIKKNWIFISSLCLLFLAGLLIKRPGFYHFSFDPQEMVGRYLKSQDIYDPQGKIKDRIFLSDSDIYLASGYLYALGKNPADYNFQHPPFLKYLYGFSLRLFENPFVLQIIFIFSLFALTYLLGLKISGDSKVSIISLIFLALDPLTANVTYNVYLDLGQTVFGLAFVLFFIFFPASWLLQGIFLGLLLSAKFWSTSLFLFALLAVYRLVILKNFNFRGFLKMLAVSVVVYLLTYFMFFLRGGNLSGFMWLQLKMIRFMLSHDSISSLGGQIWLFLTGFYNSWWSRAGLLRGDFWSPLWPISLGALCLGLIKKKLRPVLALPAFIVFGFFIATLKGAPFTRYFIFITPYLYISLAVVIYYWLTKIKKNPKIKR